MTTSSVFAGSAMSSDLDRWLATLAAKIPSPPSFWSYEEKLDPLSVAAAKAILDFQEAGGQLTKFEVMPPRFGRHELEVKLEFISRGVVTTVEGFLNPISVMVDHKFEDHYHRIGDPLPEPERPLPPKDETLSGQFV